MIWRCSGTAGYAFREHQLLAAFRGVCLDDADSAQGLVEAAGDVRVDFSALPEERTQALEGNRHGGAEDAERRQGGQREPPVQIEQNGERDDSGDEAAHELHESGADEISDALGVGHDPGDQHAGLRRIEVADREPRHVRFDAAPHVGNRALCRHPQHLRERERGAGLHERCRTGGERERREQLGASLADDVVDQEFRRRGKHQSDEAVDDHQREADGETPAPRGDERAGLAPRGRRRHFLFRFVVGTERARRIRASPARGLRARETNAAGKSNSH